MLTPQEINDKGFEKTVFNGYDMGDVDDFLETVSNDYNALYKENAILKGKLKVLVEKVEEYRSTEDAMRMALLTAQRMGEEITVEAKRTKEEMLQNTEVEIKAKLTDIAQRVAEEETRLALAAKETTKFIELSQAIMRKHSEFLSKLETARRAVSKQKGGSRQASQESGTAPKSAKAVKTAPVKAAQPVKAAPVDKAAQPPAKPMKPPPVDQPATPIPAAPIPAAPMQEVAIDDIVSQIGSVVETIAENEVAAPEAAKTPAPVPIAAESPPSLFEDDDGPVKLYSPEDGSEENIRVENSPRPKFDFDDLKFGANFDGDD